MIEKLHGIELNLIQQLAQNRIEIFDFFFKFLAFFDTIFFYLILICVIWAMYWRWGIRVFFIVIFSGIINGLLKQLFMMPRPSAIDSTIAMLTLKGYGFPSGAGQTTLLLAMLLIISFKRIKFVWVISIILALLIGFSRVYLGVHFISDIIGGWIFAMILFIFYLLLIGPFEKLLNKMNYYSVFVLIEVVGGLLLLLPINIRWSYPYYTMGIGLGYLISCKFNAFLEKTLNTKEIIVRSLINLIGVFGLFITFPLFIGKEYIYLIVSLLIGLWISYISPLIHKSFFMKYFAKTDK